MPAVREFRVGLLGLGQVGGGVARILQANASEIEARLGAKLVLQRAFVRDRSKARPELAGVALAANVSDVVAAADVDIVVEVMGGLEPARTLVLQALAAGKPVVTANKALLAAHGAEVFAAATKAGVDVYFEGAVCGGIPIVRTLREALASDRIDSIRGIANGTTNYILSAMEQGADYGPVLKKAQELGFAEADPSFDVSGKDAAQKLLLLAQMAFGVRLSLEDIPAFGIDTVTAADFAYARELGYTIKLLATAKRDPGGLQLGVRPSLVPLGSALAAVREAFNAVELTSFALGPAMLIGKGAGSLPTGSAVVGDIVEAARSLSLKSFGRVPHMAWFGGLNDAELAPERSRVGPWYLRFVVADEPGVLAQIATALGSRGISIAAVIQRERATAAQAVPVVVVTHDAREDAIAQAVSWLDGMTFAKGRTGVMPMER